MMVVLYAALAIYLALLALVPIGILIEKLDAWRHRYWTN